MRGSPMGLLGLAVGCLALSCRDGAGGESVAGGEPVTTAGPSTAPVVELPMVACRGSFSGLMEFPSSDSGSATVAAALHDYFRGSAPTWEEVPDLPAELGAATAESAVAGGWLQTGDPADGTVFVDLVDGGEVVARFHVRRLDDATWRIEAYDLCPRAADEAGLVMRSDR